MIAIVSVGIVLRCWQYLGNDSYYLDEIAVLRNLIERPWRVLLTEPLTYSQVAPPGFLAFEKLLSMTTGSTEYSLRLFPLLCSVASVVIFAKLVCNLLPRAAALASLAIFATAGPLIIYAAQLKQYSADICCTCLLALAATRYVAARRRGDAYLFGITAAVAVWFSQPAVIALGSLACLLFVGEVPRMRSGNVKADRSIFAALAMAGVSAAGSTLYAVHLLTLETREYLRQFWNDGFMPSHLPTSFSKLWPYAQLHDFYGNGIRGIGGMAYPLPGMFVALIAIGLVVLPIRRKMSGALIAAPVLFTLVAAAARQYPFADRTILFLVPSLIIAIVASVDALGSLMLRHWQRAGIAVFSVLVGLAAFPALHRLPPYHFEHLRPVAQYVASHREEVDKLYVYYGAAPAFSYYGPRYGLAGSATIIGNCHRGDPRQYFEEVDQLRGSKRVWLIIGHSLSVYQEREDILRYLDAIGTRRSTFSEPARTWGPHRSPVEAYEYDLSDPKAVTVSAATFPVLGPNRLIAAFPCGFGPQSIR